MREFLRCLLSVAVLAACGCASPDKASDEPVKRYPLRGEVTRLARDGKYAVVKHEKIDGWMEAMTMEFPIRDAAEFRKLKPGQKINAAVSVQGVDYWIHDIQVDASPNTTAGAAPLPGAIPPSTGVATPTSRSQNTRRFTLTGRVVEVTPGEKQVVVQHPEIPGYLKAGKMQYGLKDPALFQILKRGDRIEATVFSDDYTLYDVKVVK